MRLGVSFHIRKQEELRTTSRVSRKELQWRAVGLVLGLVRKHRRTKREHCTQQRLGLPVRGTNWGTYSGWGTGNKETLWAIGVELRSLKRSGGIEFADPGKRKKHSTRTRMSTPASSRLVRRTKVRRQEWKSIPFSEITIY
jgi:hypothetical protein